MNAMRTFTAGLLLALMATEVAQASDGAYGPTTLKLEARCKGHRAEKLTEVEVRPDHRISDVARGATELVELFNAKGCVLAQASQQAVGMLAEMIVLDFHGSVYAATVASNHLARTSDVRRPAPLIDFGPSARVQSASELSETRGRLSRSHEGVTAGLESAKKLWALLSASERKLLNEYVFKISAAYLRCSANRSDPASPTFYQDAAKILDESAGFHAAYLVMVKRLQKTRGN